MQSDGKFSNENTEEIDLEKPDGPLSKKKKKKKKRALIKNKTNIFCLSHSCFFFLKKDGKAHGRIFFFLSNRNLDKIEKEKKRPAPLDGRYLVDPASSHMLVLRIKPCMSQYERICTVKLRMAHYNSYSLFDRAALRG